MIQVLLFLDFFFFWSGLFLKSLLNLLQYCFWFIFRVFATPCSMWQLCSLTRDWSQTCNTKCTVSTTGLPWRSPQWLFRFDAAFLLLARHPETMTWIDLNAEIASIIYLCVWCRRPQVRFPSQEDPWRRKWPPTAVFLPGEFQGRATGYIQSMVLQRVGRNWAANTENQYCNL